MQSNQSHHEQEQQAIRLLRTLSLEDCRQIVPWFTFPDWLSLASRIDAGQFVLENTEHVIAKLQKLLVKAGYCEESYFWERLEALKSQLGQTTDHENQVEIIEQSNPRDDLASTSLEVSDTSVDLLQSTERWTPSDSSLPQQPTQTDPVSLFVHCLRSSTSPTTENIQQLKRTLNLS